MRILITVLRKNASKWLVLETDKNNYLSICQIFESTDDVMKYTVQEFNPSQGKLVDIWLPNQRGFNKWIKVD